MFNEVIDGNGDLVCRVAISRKMFRFQVHEGKPKPMEHDKL